MHGRDIALEVFSRIAPSVHTDFETWYRMDDKKIDKDP